MPLLHNLLGSTYLVQRIIYNSFRSYSSGNPLIRSLGKSLNKSEPTSEEVTLEIETDANVLVNYVCGTNLLQNQGENVKIKPDSEYPEWLWTLYTGEPKTLDEMDPNSLEYWMKVRELGLQRQKYIDSLFIKKRDHK